MLYHFLEKLSLTKQKMPTMLSNKYFLNEYQCFFYIVVIFVVVLPFVFSTLPIDLFVIFVNLFIVNLFLNVLFAKKKKNFENHP